MARKVEQHQQSKALPQHIAVIMDGNGRWASSRGLKRLDGHRQGAQTLCNLLDVLLELGIPVVSLYAFSTENWRRPRAEITGLFSLLDEFISQNLAIMLEKKIRLLVSGDTSRLPKKSRELITGGLEKTRRNKRLIANFCINYGARDEILRAAQLAAAASRNRSGKFSRRDFEKYLYTAGLPDVDLVIRTAGEKRLSNFLLYQAAYAELYFTDVLWPDFSAQHLQMALEDYRQRTRRFGAVVEI